MDGQNYLLAEIIKAANLHPDALLNIIRNFNIQPRWEDIPLPVGKSSFLDRDRTVPVIASYLRRETNLLNAVLFLGRSLNSSRFAFDGMWRTLSRQTMGAPMAPLTPTPMSAPGALKRQYPYEASYSAGAAGREIRPKPTMAGAVYSQPSPTEPPPKKKRGRPTKAEAQAKADAAAAAASSSGEVGPASALSPAPPPHLSMQTPAPTAPMPPMVTATVPEEAKPTLPPSTRMPIAGMLTPAAREPKSSSHSSSSSGKRRRARSTKSEPEESPMTRQGSQYESPYARVRAGADDSPARTAVLRHREDPGGPPRSAPGGSSEAESIERPRSDPPPPAPPQ